MTDDKTCGTCRYSDGSTCHRFPPAMVVWPTGNRHCDYLPLATYPIIAHELRSGAYEVN